MEPVYKFTLVVASKVIASMNSEKSSESSFISISTVDDPSLKVNSLIKLRVSTLTPRATPFSRTLITADAAPVSLAQYQTLVVSFHLRICPDPQLCNKES